MYKFFRPALFAIDPEDSHRLTIAALKMLPGAIASAHDPILAINVAGLQFPSPVGLAAGYDKDGEVPDALLALGFGSVEVGSITPRPQGGNPVPRLFRLREDEAVINRMGFNNSGLGTAERRLGRRMRTGILGINVGANKDAANRVGDYAEGVRRMAPFADYLTVNVSSPNTPGLRDLQGPHALAELLSAVRAGRPEGGPPLFLKLAPDIDSRDIDGIFEVVDGKIDALIIGNTTLSRPPLASRHAGETGGLSGKPLAPLAREKLTAFARATQGRIPIIAAGGIDSAEEAYARIRLGASLVQIYSAMVYHGPFLPRQIAKGLAGLLRRDGFSSVAEAVGIDLR